MKPEQIVQGVELRVPAGADLTRGNPYYGVVLEVYTKRDAGGHAHVRMQKIRADGTPSRRGAGKRAAPVTMSAIIDPEKVSPRVKA